MAGAMAVTRMVVAGVAMASMIVPGMVCGRDHGCGRHDRKKLPQSTSQ